MNKIQHILSRIKTYKNWYTLVYPMTRILKKDRILKVRGGGVFMLGAFSVRILSLRTKCFSEMIMGWHPYRLTMPIL